MKQKIKEAITQGYKNLGVPETVVDGLAALGVTVVKDESEIAAFVQSEVVKGVMKSYQSETDKVRTEYSAKLKGLETEKAELEAKLNGNQPQDKPGEKEEKPDFKAMFAEALAEAVNPLREELASIKAAKAKEDAVSALDNFVNGWDYASGFPKERDFAKRVAMKVYKAGGEQMNGEQLIAAFREEFDPAVKEKGVTDFSQPFKGDGGGGETKTDFSGLAERLKTKGLLPNEN
jgi:hypothetical protein